MRARAFDLIGHVRHVEKHFLPLCDHGARGTGKVTLWRKVKAVVRGQPIPIEYSQIIYKLRVNARSAPPPSPSPSPAAAG